MAKRLNSNLPSPSTFASIIRVILENLTIEEENHRGKDCLHRERVAAQVHSVNENCCVVEGTYYEQETEDGSATN